MMMDVIPCCSRLLNYLKVFFISIRKMQDNVNANQHMYDEQGMEME
jgi:hypothetical protein